MGQLALPCSSIGEGEMSLPPHPSPPMVDGKADPKVMRTRELSLPLNGCNTLERGPCALPGRHSLAGSSLEMGDGVGVFWGKPVLRV